MIGVSLPFLILEFLNVRVCFYRPTLLNKALFRQGLFVKKFLLKNSMQHFTNMLVYLYEENRISAP